MASSSSSATTRSRSIVTHHTPAVAPSLLTLDEARAYVSKKAKGLHKIDRAHMLARCIDGRCAAHHEGAIAMAGGDEGLLYAALAASTRMREAGIVFSSEDIRDAVFKTVCGRKNFRYHTDTHVDAAHEIEGCGHCKAALNDPVAYGLSAEHVAFIRETIADLRTDPKIGKHVCEKLKGEHAERAVFVVQHVTDITRPQESAVTLAQLLDTHTTVWALDSQVSLPGDAVASQAFVYNNDAVVLRLWALATHLHALWLGRMMEAYDADHVPDTGASVERIFRFVRDSETYQRDLTLHSPLAAGKPVYICYVETTTGNTEVAAA